MRRLVGLLHEEEANPSYAPQPGMQALDTLIAGSAPRGSRSTGGRGRAARLPPGVDLAAYRVVQEALTNTLKHAGRRAWVQICWADDELRIEVANNGGTRATAPATATAGMRERVRLYGGRLESGPRPDGGLRRARLRADRIRGMSAPIRVLIADDQPMVRAGLRMILEVEPDIDIVGEAADGNEAVARRRRDEPDVILMDVRMPHLDGLEATRRIVGSRRTARAYSS